MLRHAVRREPRFSIAGSEGGLFVEIARECRIAYGSDTSLTFLCGSDAAERIAGWDYGAPNAFPVMLGEFRSAGCPPRRRVYSPAPPDHGHSHRASAGTRPAGLRHRSSGADRPRRGVGTPGPRARPRSRPPDLALLRALNHRELRHVADKFVLRDGQRCERIGCHVRIEVNDYLVHSHRTGQKGRGENVRRLAARQSRKRSSPAPSPDPPSDIGSPVCTRSLFSSVTFCNPRPVA